MKKYLSVLICFVALLCSVSCGNNQPVAEEESIVEEEVVEVAPLNEDDFVVVVENGTTERNIISELDAGDDSFFGYYDPNYDESKEGVVKTHRGIVLGDSKEKVLELYGKGKSGDFDVDNDYCYELSKNGSVDVISDMTDFSAVMSSQCVTFVRYTYNDKYTLSFYFNEDDEVSWIFITKKE